MRREKRERDIEREKIKRDRERDRKEKKGYREKERERGKRKRREREIERERKKIGQRCHEIFFCVLDEIIIFVTSLLTLKADVNYNKYQLCLTIFLFLPSFH